MIILAARSLFYSLSSIQLMSKLTSTNPMTGLSALFSVASSIALMAAGIGFILRQNWSRVLAVWLYAIGLLFSIPIIFSIIMLYPTALIGYLVPVAFIVILNLNIVKNQFN